MSVASGHERLQVTWTLPADLQDAVADVADLLALERDWLNAGAAGVVQTYLPEGYEERLRTRVYGALVVSVLSRRDLIRLKLVAAIDDAPQGRHVSDLRDMKATTEELADAVAWVRSRIGPATLLLLEDRQATLATKD